MALNQDLQLLINYLNEHYFRNAKKDEEFIQAALKHSMDTPSIERNIACNFKNDKLAQSKLNSGKNASQESLEEVIAIFNEAMAQASIGSELLAHIYANRSLVLTKAARYEESLKDIKYALENNYPDHLKALLYARKAKNLLALNPEANIEETIAEAKEWALKLDGEKKDKFLDDLDKIKLQKFREPVIQNDNRIFLPKDLNVKGYFDVLTLKTSDKFGRHLIASRDIPAGEPLMIKTAYALVLRFEYRYKRCGNCSKFCYSSIPCQKCSNVIYCCKKCHDIAFKEYHDIECPVISSLITKNQGYDLHFLMSLRLFTKAFKEYKSIQSLYDSVKTMKLIKDPIAKNFEENVYDDSKYVNVYSLYCKPMDRSLEIFYAMQTIDLMYYLIARTDLFDKKVSNITELVNHEWALFVGGLIYHHIVISNTNLSAIPLKTVNTQDDIDCGGILIPLASLCTNGCYCNTSSLTCRNLFSLYAIEPIKKGQKILIRYGPHYRLAPTLTRKKLIKDLQGFDCACDACIFDWGPSYSHKRCLSESAYMDKNGILKSFLEGWDYFNEFHPFNKPTKAMSPDKIKILFHDLFKLMNDVSKNNYPNYESEKIKELLVLVFKWIDQFQM